MFIDLGAVFIFITVTVMLVWEVVQFINEPERPEEKTAKCAFKQDYEIKKLFIIENGNITRIR